MKHENPKFQISNIEVFFSKADSVVFIRDYCNKSIFKSLNLERLNELYLALYLIGDRDFVIECDNGTIKINKADKGYVISMLNDHAELLKPIS